MAIVEQKKNQWSLSICERRLGPATPTAKTATTATTVAGALAMHWWKEQRKTFEEVQRHWNVFLYQPGQVRVLLLWWGEELEDS